MFVPFGPSGDFATLKAVFTGFSVFKPTQCDVWGVHAVPGAEMSASRGGSVAGVEAAGGGTKVKCAQCRDYFLMESNHPRACTYHAG